MPDGRGRREDAPETLGHSHVAGVDGEFSRHVQNPDIPRCPECRVLFANAPPPFGDTLCPECEEDYEQAEEASRRRAELGIGGAPT